MISRSLFLEEKKLRVFDFDDTLVRTDSYVYVNHRDGTTTKLTPGEFAIYKKRKGDEFDFRDFKDVVNPVEIKAITRILRDMVKKAGKDRKVYILTARGHDKPIEKYLKDIGIRNVEVVALGDGNPETKADWIEQQVEEEEYDDVFFIDDSQPNVKAVKRRLSKLGVKHRAKLMKSKWKKNRIFEITIFILDGKRKPFPLGGGGIFPTYLD